MEDDEPKKMAALRKSRHCQRLSALEELQLALDAVVLVGVVRVGLAARNGGPFAGELGVERDEFLLILRDVLFGEDGCFRAFGDAHGAVDAFVGVDHEKVRAFAEAVDRADVDAVGALAADAGFADNMRH